MQNETRHERRSSICLPWVFGILSLLTAIDFASRKSLGSVVVLQFHAWAFRILSHDANALQDLTIRTAFQLWSIWPSCYSSMVLRLTAWLGQSADRTPSVLIISLVFFVSLCCIATIRLLRKSHGDPDDQFDGPFKPFIYPCRATHTRLFPEKHSFRHSYLLVGVPVGWTGAFGSLVSVDAHLLPRSKQRHGWFQIRGVDYLGRGGDNLDLHAKLCQYLQSQGVDETEWTHAYLVTAPRFLGYHFNPVSFWYIYSADLKLKFMVLEVNNTFGERRPYLLRGSKIDDAECEQAHGPNEAVKFTQSWPKDFHVSPFNSREGFYSLKAHEPFARLGSIPSVDNIITLKSSKNHPKLIARIFSTAGALDPASLGRLDTVRFLATWWWVGLITFPRIVREAAKLFFKRKLHVWFRPEIKTSSIGREHTDTELIVAQLFPAYLQHLLSKIPDRLRITVGSRIPSVPEATFESSSTAADDVEAPHITLDVLSPAFYSRLLHYPTLSSALDSECPKTDYKNRTIHIIDTNNNNDASTSLSPTHVLHLLAKAADPTPSTTPKNKSKYSPRWAFLRNLRTPPPSQSYPSSGILLPSFATAAAKATTQPSLNEADNKASETKQQDNPITITQVTDQNISHTDLDTFIQQHLPRSKASTYRKTLTRYFIAQRWFLGFEGLVDLVDLMVRILLLLFSMTFTFEIVDQVKGMLFGSVENELGTISSVIVKGLVAMAPHVWQWVKGQ